MAHLLESVCEWLSELADEPVVFFGVEEEWEEWAE